jgi:hypothetical protein
MSVVERTGDGPGNAACLLHRNAPFTIEEIAERLAYDEGHYIIEKAVCLAGIEKRENVRMVEPRSEANLTKEAVRAERRGQIGMEYLYGNVPSVAKIFSEIDRSHAATSDLANDPVFLVERLRQLVLHFLLRLAVPGSAKL